MKDLKKRYQSEIKELDAEISRYYLLYGRDNVIEYRNLIQTLPDSEVKLLMEDMGRFGQEFPQYQHLLPVRTSIYKLNRLEGLKLSIRLNQMRAAGRDEKRIEEYLMLIGKTSWGHAQKTLGLGENFNVEDEEIVRMLIHQGWANEKNFSDRIWDNREKLINYLQNDYAQGIARGTNYTELMQNLHKRCEKTSLNDTYRLVYTEGTFIENEATSRVFIDNGYTKYNIAIADEEACPICKEIKANGPYFYAEKVTGLNFPPFHPRCRCSNCPVVER